MKDTKMVLDIITSLIDAEGSDYFLGGSRRFGWNYRGRPDFDIFFYIPERDLYRVVNDLGLAHASVENYHLSGFTHYRAAFFSYDIDLLITMEKVVFDSLLEEHQRVDKFLDGHPEILRLLKRFNVKGSEKYRAVLSLI